MLKLKKLTIRICFLSYLVLFVHLESANASCTQPDSPTDQSIVLTVDISSSVEAHEMTFQLGAYQASLLTPEVQDKLLGCGCTEVAVVFFGSEGRTVLEARNIVDATDINRLADFFAQLRTSESLELYQTFEVGGSTDVAKALETAIGILNEDNNTSFRRAILVSGDGVSSSYSEPELLALQEHTNFNGIEVSAVPITLDIAPEDLISYFPSDFVSRPTVDRRLNVLPQFQEPVSGKVYESLTAFYEEFVVNDLGTLNPAESFQDLQGVLNESIQAIACRPMM